MAFSVSFFYTWLMAYFHENEVTVTINDYGEGKLESFLFPVFFVFGIITFIFNFGEYCKKIANNHFKKG